MSTLRQKLLLLSLACASLAFPLHGKQHSTSIEKAVESAAHSECFFNPPKGWEIADPTSLSPRVKIAFLKNTGKGFCPSINLAIEETQASLNEYLKAVKAIHEQDRSSHWRALGKMRTSAGMAQLTEINSTSEWGPIRILQLILVKDSHAYVVTAASLKEEFSNYYKEIQSTFRSLTLSNDLLSHIPQSERRVSLEQQEQALLLAAQDSIQSSEDPSFQEKKWIAFQQSVIDNFNDMGAFWQVLLLKNTQKKLLSYAENANRQNVKMEIESNPTSFN
jgi:hypothetical protein